MLTLIHLPTADFSVWLLILILLVGFAALAYGGDILTAGAAAISVNIKIAPVVVGLTVVSIATSMPEMATSLIAARNNPGIALGNILGSNIANVGLILGVAAMIAPIRIEMNTVRREMSIILIGVTLVFSIFALSGEFHRFEGFVLLFLTLAYFFYVIRSAKMGSIGIPSSVERISRKSNLVALSYILAGSIFLLLGANWLVESAVEIATWMGASELFIGLTIVAIGTSLPELAASVAAVRSGHGDLCIGNIVGSNLLNMLLIGGGVSVLAGMDVQDEVLVVEFSALLFFSFLLFWFLWSGHTIRRREGFFLLLLYFGMICLSGLS